MNSLALSALFQIVVVSSLALLLRSIYLRLYREKHLKYWALSWATLAAYLVFALIIFLIQEKMPRHSWAVMSLLPALFLFGNLQAPLIALAALSLRRSRPQAWVLTALFAVPIIIGAIFIALYGAGRAPGSAPAWFAPRSFLAGVSMAWFALAFPGRQSRTWSRSEPVTIFFCLAYALHQCLVGMSTLGLEIYPGYFSSAAALLGAVLPLGITIGIVLAIIADANSSERRMSVYWEAAHDGMALVDFRGVVLKVNDAICRMVGKTRSELENNPFTTCLQPAEGDMLLSRFKQVAASRQIESHIEAHLTLWDGTMRWMDMTVAFVESGSDSACLIILRDITRRRETEDALRESETRFRDLLASVRLVGVILDTAGNILFSNGYLAQLTGWPAEEIRGKNWFEIFIPPLEREPIKLLFADAMAGKASMLHHENDILTREGKPRLIQWTNTILHDPAGRIVGSASLGTDVTEHKQLEERYRQAQKLESVGRLAGGIAHDFNNLLTVINGYGELLMGEVNEQDPLYSGLQEIQLAGAKASALTQQLLAFSRKQVLQPKLLDLNTVIGDASRMLRRMIGEDIELITHLDPALGPVNADEGQIHQVLMNLAVNARDAMPEGGQLIIESSNVLISECSMDAVSEIQPGSYASISLTDTGIGMSQETRTHLFEPFFTTKERGKGTGLGLSTVYGIVRQSGGYISVTSELARGTSFRILLPRVRDAEEALAHLQAEHMPRRGTETVLLVEDHQEVRKIVVDTLQRFGYEVLEASSGEQALLLSERHQAPIHLMLTDLVMPGMTGRALADRLKTVRPEMRVLYMSGYTDRGGFSHESPDTGAGYIQKPFTPQELAMKVGDFLGCNRARARILVVDDELSIRILFRKVLQSAGYEVVEAANGKIAMEKVREGGVDLIITDLVMPEQEGVETIRLLRQSHPHIKLVAMSGAFGGRLLETATLLGAQRTLLKPISPAMILKTTQDLLQGR